MKKFRGKKKRKGERHDSKDNQYLWVNAFIGMVNPAQLSNISRWRKKKKRKKKSLACCIWQVSVKQ